MAKSVETETTKKADNERRLVRGLRGENTNPDIVASVFGSASACRKKCVATRRHSTGSSVFIFDAEQRQ